MGEIEEEAPPASADELSPLLSDQNPPQRIRSVRTKVPEVEVNLYKLGKGPIDVFKSSLGGWDQDQLEVGDIVEKYGFKSVYAFTPGSGRGAPIRFNPKNGRSLLSYKDGSVVYIDGQPKDCFEGGGMFLYLSWKKGPTSTCFTPKVFRDGSYKP